MAQVANGDSVPCTCPGHKEVTTALHRAATDVDDEGPLGYDDELNVRDTLATGVLPPPGAPASSASVSETPNRPRPGDVIDAHVEDVQGGGLYLRWHEHSGVVSVTQLTGRLAGETHPAHFALPGDWLRVKVYACTEALFYASLEPTELEPRQDPTRFAPGPSHLGRVDSASPSGVSLIYTTSLLQPGDVVTARVEELRDDGLVLVCGSQLGYLWASELDWRRVRRASPSHFAQRGDWLRVKVTATTETTFLASLRALNPELDPWRDASRYSPGTQHWGRVYGKLGSTALVELESGAVALLLHAEEVTDGDWIEIVVTRMDAAAEAIDATLVPRETSL